MTLAEKWRQRVDEECRTLDKGEASTLIDCANEYDAEQSTLRQRLAEMTAHRDAWVEWADDIEVVGTSVPCPPFKLEWEAQ